ncbi:uncharacterized protein N7458_004332 [Penicillium daleae]|uniref:Uncharacterized protein n=1 Tax=Penicillium daleae TaxID=63821 RepID=A0AAD6G5R0_9EURO|nr:uncharacterized protein N7458_004332 [Penicillium daleae]KAJ5456068.1 hypothetical protein N7458_004332 [Penicillium daleae]
MYPPTWANPTPSNGPTTGQPGQAPESQSTSHAITSGAENDSTTFQAPNQTAAAPPLDPSQQQPSTNMATASVPQIQNSHQTFNMQGISETSIPQAAGGQKRVIAVRPRKTRRAVQPGFTSTGEKILFIQSVGRYARFVVTDTEGNIRLVSGSQPAIDLANSAGVPHTLQDPAEIQKLRGLVRRGGGEYGLEFVAIGEWDIGNTRLPFIVVGFYYENENGRREEAISRSSLIKILGTREGEKLIVESIVGHPDLSLREALEAQIAPRKQEVSSNNAPQLLLQGEQSQPWWFQTPQHSGSHTAFKVAPAQQAPYPNHFQQFASQQSLRPISLQYQQPFPSQFQPGPFAMPPQPILNSSMMKPRANSPTTSMMSEEL